MGRDDDDDDMMDNMDERNGKNESYLDTMNVYERTVEKHLCTKTSFYSLFHFIFKSYVK